MRQKIVLTFIGGGNMATGIIGGLIHQGWRTSHIQVVEPLELQRKKLTKDFSIHCATTFDDLAQPSDAVIIALKPQITKDVITPLKKQLQDLKGPIISIAAGIRMAQLEAWLGNRTAIVRVMPNTPALIGMGASALMANTRCSDEHKKNADLIMQSVGITAWVDNDDQMDAITALSGSGPAYFFYFMELMYQCGIKLGLEPELAERFTISTGLGAAKLASERGLPLCELRKEVTSPGGTTERALGVFQEYGLDNTVCNALKAAYTRSKELSDDIG